MKFVITNHPEAPYFNSIVHCAWDVPSVRVWIFCTDKSQSEEIAKNPDRIFDIDLRYCWRCSNNIQSWNQILQFAQKKPGWNNDTSIVCGWIEKSMVWKRIIFVKKQSSQIWEASQYGVQNSDFMA